MKKDKLAVQSFQSQLDELSTINYQQAQVWKTFTKELMVKYLGSESEFLKPFNGIYSIFYSGDYFAEDRYKSQLILKKCIEYIQSNGTYSPPNSNFITRLSEGWAIALFTFVVTTVWSMGYFVGDYSAKNRIDQDRIDLTNELHQAKKENSMLLLRLTKEPAQNNTQAKKK
jgi:hypothetical protein